MRFFTRRRIVAGLAASAVLVGAGFFVGAGVAGAVQNSFSFGTIRNIVAVTENSPAVISSTSWQTLTTQTFSPSASARAIRVRFTGESQCVTLAGQWCSMRVLVNNVEAHPQSGSDLGFDSGTGLDKYESHSMEKISTNVSSNNTITVQWIVVGSGSFRLDNWSLSIEALE
jgi:hypothetical protein